MVRNEDGTLVARGTNGLGGQFLGGLLLGAVWSPCIGPTLGGAIALASQGQNLGWAFLIMLSFSAGVSTLILGIGIGGQGVVRKRAQALRGLARNSKTILGVVFVAVGLMILFRLHHLAEAWARGDMIPMSMSDQDALAGSVGVLNVLPKEAE